MGTARASVIVRTRDKQGTIERCLSLLRRQTVEPEIVVVDSGSSDRTVALAREWCDRLIEIRPEEFSYGAALNLGARSAAAPIHFAVSAHIFLAREDWIERSLRHYERPDVAAVMGCVVLPDGRPQHEVVYQDAALSRADRVWGFSNTASSWRASVWERFPFDEGLEACEDKEWSWRVLDQGWVVVLDPALWVPDVHRRRDGALSLYQRTKRESRVLAAYGALPRMGPGDALRAWWDGSRDASRGRRLVDRANPLRVAEIAGRYFGERSARPRNSSEAS
jgi:glycosyltransferase involved in cell wall biosynthesis